VRVGIHFFPPFSEAGKAGEGDKVDIMDLTLDQDAALSAVLVFTTFGEGHLLHVRADGILIVRFHWGKAYMQPQCMEALEKNEYDVDSNSEGDEGGDGRGDAYQLMRRRREICNHQVTQRSLLL
jgi:hypothetical protein